MRQIAFHYCMKGFKMSPFFSFVHTINIPPYHHISLVQFMQMKNSHSAITTCSVLSSAMFRREDREIALGVSIENGCFERCGRLIAMFLLDFFWQTPPPPLFFSFRNSHNANTPQIDCCHECNLI